MYISSTARRYASCFEWLMYAQCSQQKHTALLALLGRPRALSQRAVIRHVLSFVPSPAAVSTALYWHAATSGASSRGLSTRVSTNRPARAVGPCFLRGYRVLRIGHLPPTGVAMWAHFQSDKADRVGSSWGYSSSWDMTHVGERT